MPSSGELAEEPQAENKKRDNDEIAEILNANMGTCPFK
jgi:hypothetical protein